MAAAEDVTLSDLVSLAVLQLKAALDAEELDTTALKVPARSLKALYKYDLSRWPK